MIFSCLKPNMKLQSYIKHWMMESSALDEVAYTKSLKKRIDTDMTIKSSFLNPNETDMMNESYNNISENNTFTYKKMAQENSQVTPITENDHLFIGAEDGHLIEYSHNKQKIIKTFDNLMQKSILALTITNNKQDLFVSDIGGNLKQMEIATSKIKHNYGRLQGIDKIESIVISKDDKHFFVGNLNTGILQQWSIAEKKLIVEYDKVLINYRGYPSRFQPGIIVTPDNMYLFAIGCNGATAQVNIYNQFVSKRKCG